MGIWKLLQRILIVNPAGQMLKAYATLFWKKATTMSLYLKSMENNMWGIIKEIHNPLNPPELVAMIIFDVLVFLILLSLSMWVDASFGSKEKMEGVVVGKTYHPPTTTMTMSGNTSIVTHVPASWSVEAAFNEIGEVLSCSVDRESYNNAKEGSEIEALVSSGLFTSNYYCV